ncbi:MAG: hypothetical protein DWQ15_07870 [Proteobacteria bacterium]|nr:MAG: hypothetical protein DWQ15_07870 [Pseudomonadota bacterium]
MCVGRAVFGGFTQTIGARFGHGALGRYLYAVPCGWVGVMFVSFAAGGLAEMSLIALSLNFNPIVVAIHHLVRITLTIFCGKLLEKYVR